MKRIFFLIFLVVISVGTFLLYREHSVLSISYGQWHLQAPVWIAISSIFLMWLLTYLLRKAIKAMLTIKTSWSAWLSERRNKDAKHRLLQGFVALVGEDWGKAANLLNDAPIHLKFFADLGCLYASIQEKNTERQERYFQTIIKEYPFLKSTLYLFLAKCQYSLCAYQEVKRSIQNVHMEEVSPRTLLTLQNNLYATTSDIENQFNLLPLLKKHKVISEEGSAQIQIDYYKNHLTNSAYSLETLKEAWKKIPKVLRSASPLLHHYGELLSQKGNVAS